MVIAFDKSTGSPLKATMRLSLGKLLLFYLIFDISIMSVLIKRISNLSMLLRALSEYCYSKLCGITFIIILNRSSTFPAFPYYTLLFGTMRQLL